MAIEQSTMATIKVWAINILKLAPICITFIIYNVYYIDYLTCFYEYLMFDMWEGIIVLSDKKFHMFMASPNITYMLTLKQTVTQVNV